MSIASAKDTNRVSWFSLGYEMAPFSNKANQSQLFFKSQSLINTLNKLCSLDSGDVCVTTLTGERGCGKSTCLRALSKMRTHYRSIILEATAGLSPQNLVKVIFRDHIEIYTTSRLPTTEECVMLIKALNTSRKQIRILIDKAQELPSTTLSLIRKLCNIQSNGSRLQFVLCTHKPQSVAEIYQDDQIKTQSIQLLNLTRQETERFINIKLQSTPTTQKPQHAPRGFADQVYEKTKGNLYKINETAGLLLPDVLKPQPSLGSEQQSLFAQKNTAKWAGVLILFTACLGVSLTKTNTHLHNKKSKPSILRAPQAQRPPSPEKVSRLLFVLSHP